MLPNKQAKKTASDEDPAFEMLYFEVVFSRQAIVVESLAGVTVTMEEVAIQPEAEVATGDFTMRLRRKRVARRGRKKNDCQSIYVQVLLESDWIESTYSPAPMTRLSALPLMKYKFSPVQG